MSGVVEDKDFGWKDILAGLTAADGKTTKVGIVGAAAKQPAGGTVTETKKRRRKRKGLAGKILGAREVEVVKTRQLTLAEVAAIHEFGAPEADVPERSFLRAAVDDNKDAITDEFIRLGESIFDAEPEALKITLEEMGGMVAGFMKDKILGGLEPPLSAEMTELREGDWRPLAVLLAQSTTLEHEEKDKDGGEG